MSTSRRDPEPKEPPPARRPNDTVHAIDTAVSAAAAEVERRLAAAGVPTEQRVTPRDVLRSRYPRDSYDDEAVTEEMPHADLFPSLAPFAVDPRPSSSLPVAVAQRPAPPAPLPAPARAGRFFASARSASWALSLFLLGGLATFAAVMAVRTHRLETALPSRPRVAAAAAPPVLADAGAAALADAAAPRGSQR
ncbi:hypothetical protein BH11MYX4_BH11MYX4_11030 [soil metagenome]